MHWDNGADGPEVEAMREREAARREHEDAEANLMTLRRRRSEINARIREEAARSRHAMARANQGDQA